MREPGRSKLRRHRAAISATIAVGAAAAASPAIAAAAHAQPSARAHAASGHGRKAGAHAHSAASLHAEDVARLHYVGSVGEQVYETGSASGTLPGGMRVYMTFAATFRGRFTIYTRAGRIYGHGSARPHGGGVWESFAGTLTLTGGTGRYRHAHGAAALYGTFNRDSYALTIKTAGTLRY